LVNAGTVQRLARISRMVIPMKVIDAVAWNVTQANDIRSNCSGDEDEWQDVANTHMAIALLLEAQQTALEKYGRHDLKCPHAQVRSQLFSCTCGYAENLK